MSAFDLMNQSMQCAEPETDSVTPWIKLRGEMSVFTDGKRVNETCCQPSFASHQMLFNKKAQNEWSVWEENRALWEENQVLWIENRMLWEENKALRYDQSQNKSVRVIYTDTIQQSLQKERKPFQIFQERKIGFQVNPSHKVCQAVQEKYRVLEDFQQENKTVPVIWKGQKAITLHEESKDASSDLQKDTDIITPVEEGDPGLAPQQERGAKPKSTSLNQNKIKSAPSMQGDSEILQALQDLHELLHTFLKVNHLHGEKQGCHTLYNTNSSFQEDYNKLKLQLQAVKTTMSDIMAQMEMLEKELIAITSPMYEETRQKLATEHQLGEM